jgi:hypothetical protein
MQGMVGVTRGVGGGDANMRDSRRGGSSLRMMGITWICAYCTFCLDYA